jgi:hypothetical protein
MYDITERVQESNVKLRELDSRFAERIQLIKEQRHSQ